MDPEQFRGPSGSFPIQTRLIVAPSFNLQVMGSMASFQKYFTGSFLDEDAEGFHSTIQEKITLDSGKIINLTENNLAIQLTFICKAIKTLLISLTTEQDRIVYH